DMEWAGAIAPAATIDLVVSQDTLSTPGINLSALYIVDNNLAPVMSMSYGYCESLLGAAGNAFYNSLFEQAAAEGISVIVAAGDDGSAACNDPNNSTYVTSGFAVSGIASTPFDVAVGGTDFDDASDPSPYWNSTSTAPNYSSALSYIPEMTWNDSCAQVGDSASCAPARYTAAGTVAGGGGPSSCAFLTGTDPNATCAGGYSKPAWQSGPGVPADGVRDIPDVSLFAAEGRNGSFYVFCEADVNPNPSSNCVKADSSDIQPVSGTSVSAQAFAGVMALIDQKTGERQGNPNFILYTLAARPGASCTSDPTAVKKSSCVFYDIVNGNDSLPCEISTPTCQPIGTDGGSGLVVAGSNPPVPAWTAAPGYDLATGLGSVNVANLINQWSSVNFTPSTVTLTLSPTTLTHGQAASVNVQVTAQGGVPTGAVSLLGDLGARSSGIANFTLSGGAASGSISSLPGGTYNVTAHYAGDGTFGASDSSPVQVTVSKENSATTLAIETQDSLGRLNNTNASSFAYGSFYLLNVEVENAAGNSCGANQVPAIACPSGTVNLTDNGAPLNPTVNTLNSLGEMQDNPIQLPPGSHTLAASYLGDTSFNPSESPTDQVTVTQAVTNTSFVSIIEGAQVGTTVSFNVVVSAESNGAPPTGTVQFLNGSTPMIGTVTYSSSPMTSEYPAELKATFSTVLTAPINITAQYSGDANYLSSSDGPFGVGVLPGFGLTVNPTSITVPAGQTATATVTLAMGGGFNSGVALGCQLPVTFTEATCSVTPQALSASGQGTITITTTAPQAGAALFPRSSPPNDLLAAVALLGLALTVLCFVTAPRRRYACGILFSMVLLLSLFLISCGGGGQGAAPYKPPPNPGTPAGTYTVTITAT
ncbi:MAG: Ig-like domain repeat protein, partial [Terriglobia bacterium]